MRKVIIGVVIGVYTISLGILQLLSAEVWERTGSFDGEKSGAVISLGLVGNGTLFACVNTGAPAYMSIDNGATWKKSSLPSNNYINSYAVKDSIVLAASLAGVYRSINHGNTWKLSNSGLTSLNIKSIKFSSNGLLYVGTHGGGVFRSTDNGLTWKAVNSGLSILKISALSVLDSITLIAATDGEGMFVSVNNGDTWKSINGEVRLNSVRSFAVNSSGVLFAGTDQYGIFRSTTKGETWEFLDADITSSVNAILCKGNEVYVATGQNGIFHSIDNGSTWLNDNTGIEGNVFYSLAINALGVVLVGGNGGAVYRKVVVNSVDELPIQNHLTIHNIYYDNNVLRLSFHAPREYRASICVYSIRGEKITESVTSDVEAGENLVLLSLISYPTGTYICRIETPFFIASKLFQIQ